MKTNFTAKLFGLTLVTALTLTTLTACGNGGAAASSGTASGSALQSGGRRQRGHRAAQRQPGDRDGLRRGGQCGGPHRPQ